LQTLYTQLIGVALAVKSTTATASILTTKPASLLTENSIKIQKMIIIDVLSAKKLTIGLDCLQ